VRQFKNRMFASENRRRILLIYNNLPSIFVIESASGLAISLIGRDQAIFYVDWTHPIIPPACVRDIHPCLTRRAE
jgi:hypothetical protein